MRLLLQFSGEARLAFLPQVFQHGPLPASRPLLSSLSTIGRLRPYHIGGPADVGETWSTYHCSALVWDYVPVCNRRTSLYTFYTLRRR
jgi:hypothetical protein